MYVGAFFLVLGAVLTFATTTTSAASASAIASAPAFLEASVVPPVIPSISTVISASAVLIPGGVSVVVVTSTMSWSVSVTKVIRPGRRS